MNFRLCVPIIGNETFAYITIGISFNFISRRIDSNLALSTLPVIIFLSSNKSKNRNDATRTSRFNRVSFTINISCHRSSEKRIIVLFFFLFIIRYVLVASIYYISPRGDKYRKEHKTRKIIIIIYMYAHIYICMKKKKKKSCIHACDWFCSRKHAESGVVN